MSDPVQTPVAGDQPVTLESYGTYYASGFQLKEIFGDPAVLYLIWRREDDAWKIASYEVLTP